MDHVQKFFRFHSNLKNLYPNSFYKGKLPIEHTVNPLKDYNGDYFISKIMTNLRIDCKKPASLLVKDFS